MLKDILRAGCFAAALATATTAGGISHAVAETVESPILCFYSFARFGPNTGPGQFEAAGRAITADGRILSQSTADLTAMAALGGLTQHLDNSPTPAEIAEIYTAAQDTGTVLSAAILARLSELADAVRDGDLLMLSLPVAPTEQGTHTLGCYLPADDGVTLESITVRVSGDVEVVNSDPLTLVLATELAEIFDVTEMLHLTETLDQ